MEIRVLHEEDYDETLIKWWSDNGFPAPAKDSLPDNGKGGFMVYKRDVNICTGFLYQTNSKTAWCEFIVANKEYREKDRGEAIELLIDTISIFAKELGYNAIYTSLTHPVLISRYEKCGYVSASKNCTEMIKRL